MPSRYAVAPLDLSKLETYPLASRKSKVSAEQIGKPAAPGGSFRDFWESLPDILAGRATIRGLRISVAHVVNLVANGLTPAEIVQELPDLDEEDVRQALAYAAALAHDEMHPLRA